MPWNCHQTAASEFTILRTIKLREVFCVVRCCAVLRCVDLWVLCVVVPNKFLFLKRLFYCSLGICFLWKIGEALLGRRGFLLYLHFPDNLVGAELAIVTGMATFVRRKKKKGGIDFIEQQLK